MCFPKFRDLLQQSRKIPISRLFRLQDTEKFPQDTCSSIVEKAGNVVQHSQGIPAFPRTTFPPGICGYRGFDPPELLLNPAPSPFPLSQENPVPSRHPRTAGNPVYDPAPFPNSQPLQPFLVYPTHPNPEFPGFSSTAGGGSNPGNERNGNNHCTSLWNGRI